MVLIVFPVLITVSITYIKSNAIISAKVQESINNNIEQAKLNIDDMLENSKGVLNIFILNNDFKKFLRKHTRVDSPQDYGQIREIMNSLSDLVKSSKKIESIFVYDINDDILITSFGTAFEDSKFSSGYIFDETVRKGRTGEWIINSQDLSPYTVLNDNYVTYAMPIRIYEEELNVGYVFININEKSVYQYIEGITFNGSENMMVANDKGEIISFKDKSFLGKSKTPEYYFDCINLLNNNGSFPLKINHGNSLAFMSQSASSKLCYFALVSITNINREILTLRNIIILVCILTVFFAFIISFLFLRSIYVPMDRLVNAMEKLVFRGDFDYFITDKRKDEFGILYNSFNQMVKDMKQLFNQLFEEKLKKKEAQLKFLQAEINPHFLYNTLNSIYYISKLHGIKEITDLSYSLTNFFRISLNGGLETITVKEMLNQINHYLVIQNIRYKDQFELVIDVDQELLEYSVLKFLLQPLVENSIIHGMKNKNEKGIIEITGYIVGGNIKFSIRDNGLGISPENLKKIQYTLSQMMEDVEVKDMFALRNIHRRIRLYYGEQYGLRIFSTEGEGTVVEVILPFLKKEGEWRV